jgi:hypothetical protein
VAATFDSKGELRLYLNGKMVTSAPAQPRPTPQLERISKLYERLHSPDRPDGYEARHARLVLDYAATVMQRRQMLRDGQLKPLAEPASQAAADHSYVDTVLKLAKGLQMVLDGYAKSDDPEEKRLFEIWQATR